MGRIPKIGTNKKLIGLLLIILPILPLIMSSMNPITLISEKSDYLLSSNAKYYPLFKQLYVGDYIHENISNATYYWASLTSAISVDYDVSNFQVGDNLTFYCQNVVTGTGLLHIEFLNSAQYAQLQAAQPYTPLVEIYCDNVGGGPYESYGSMNYEITVVDTYYLVIHALSISIPILSLDYKVGFIGDLPDPYTDLMTLILLSNLIGTNNSTPLLLGVIIGIIALIGIIIAVILIITRRKSVVEKESTPIVSTTPSQPRETIISGVKCPECGAPLETRPPCRCEYCGRLIDKI